MDLDIPEDKRAAILEAIHAGAPQKIVAIKLVREATGCGLAEAKQYVERTGEKLYVTEPEKFSAPPKGKGCVGMLVAAGMLLLGVCVLKRILA